MTTPNLQTNEKLFHYLVELADHLQSKGESELAAAVEAASRFAIGSQTEFLGEAQAALRRLCASNTQALSREQCSRIGDILRQIQVAFIGVGGA